MVRTIVRALGQFCGSLTSSPSARSRPGGGWLLDDPVSNPDVRSTRQLTALRTQSIADSDLEQAPFVPSLLRWASQPSAGSWSNACGGYWCPSGAVISISRNPSAASSDAFFTAAAVVSRRRVMRPDVSLAVIKNRMGRPDSKSSDHLSSGSLRRRATR